MNGEFSGWEIMRERYTDIRMKRHTAVGRRTGPGVLSTQYIMIKLSRHTITLKTLKLTAYLNEKSAAYIFATAHAVLHQKIRLRENLNPKNLFVNREVTPSCLID